MSREVQVRFCERRGVRFPPPTLLILVHGTRDDAETLREDIANVLAPLGAPLEAKTRIVHLEEGDEGFDFLGATRGRTVRVSALEGGMVVVTAA